MRPVASILALGLSCWLVPGIAFADHPAAEGEARQPGHSQNGDAFDDGPRGHAFLMSGTGRVHLPVTSAVPAVQPLFDQGVGQLHGFWYFEAERSFRQVSALDPNCAMAYWGMAMANVNNDKRAKKFIEQAVARKATASPREQLWIDGLAAFYADGKKEEKSRRRDLVRALEQIVQDYPDELEAKAFLILQIWLNSSKGLAINSHQAVESLLADLFAAQPLHPAHHFRIHLWDKEKPQRAIQSAALCGESAPAIAHMWHMPGHIYSDLHRYAEAAWQQEASARVDHAYMMQTAILPDQIHNYAHNNEWLIRDMVHVGRARDALALARNMIELPRHPQYNLLTKASSSQFGRARLFEVLERFEMWDELIALAETAYLEPSDQPTEQVKRLRALAAAQLSKGDITAGKATIAALEEMLARVKSEQQAAGDEAEKKAREEKKPDDEIAKAKTEAMKGRDQDIKRFETALADLAGRVAMAAGQFDAAKAEFEKAGDMRKEFLARLAVMAGDAPRAEELAREVAEKAPGEALPLASYVEVLSRIGKGSEAKAKFDELRALSAQFDLDMPVFQRLSPLAQELGMPADWRIPATTAADFGRRPPLESLGPVHWHPPRAQSWSLPDADGKQVSLRDFGGKPVVVVFYLGLGCLHCAEQLRALVPLESEFAAAGISLVAISTETAEQLRKAIADRPAADTLPSFPILVDPALDVFRKYSAFDDFENVPLHGTFLIDGSGALRWLDIGAEPFMDLKFVLSEAKRQIALP